MDNKATIFNIQKFCLHDGPGIRTTVFFKGCPLRCKWCANPESQRRNREITYDKKKCINCLKCVRNCPVEALKPDDLRGILIDNDICRGKLECVNNCPTGALSYEGEEKTIKEILEVCLQDVDFYEESGGGVTISGGEGFSQPEIVKELIKELKKHQIHTAIETTGHVSQDTFKEIAPEFDLLLFDVKHYDPEKHKEGTGVTNELILKNLKWAVDHDLKILARIPVIPEFNNSLEDARNLADLLNEIGIKEVQLLPFHQFGERKYELLEKDYAYQGVKALKQDELLDYLEVFKEKGLEAFF